MKKKATVIIQARMGSTRLPGKVLKSIQNYAALEFLVRRLRMSSMVKNIVVATTENMKDNAIEKFCIEKELNYFRGPEEDVLKRYQLSAQYYDAEDIVRISGDCPFTDWEMLDKLVNLYFQENADFVTNMYKKTFPLGFAIEVFKSKKLLELNNLDENEKEHVTTHFINNPAKYNFISVKKKTDLSKFRMTLDTNEDYEVISKVADSFTDIYFKFKDIEELINSRPDYLKKNQYIKQKSNFQESESSKVRSVIYEEIN